MTVDTYVVQASGVEEFYAAFHEHLAERQQFELLQGKSLHARKTGRRVVLARRALLAEGIDPEPPDRPHRCDCETCAAWLSRVP